MKFDTLLLCIFLIPSVNAMEEWNSDSEDEDFQWEYGITSTKKNDIDSFYDSGSLTLIQRKLFQSKITPSNEVEGVILLAKEGKILQDITRVRNFAEQINLLGAKEWQANEKVNGILVYFKKSQNFDTASELLKKKIWGIREVRNLKDMEQLYKINTKEDTKVIKHKSSSNNNCNN